MKKQSRRFIFIGCLFLVLFIIWTILIQTIDVKPVGQNKTNVGFSTINCWFHNITGVNMTLYSITDWLGLIAIIICFGFGILGLVQLIKRKSLLKVDVDIIILGIYYVIVIFAYLIFEMIPINFRPILIDGYLETSYPSSTTLLIMCVMLTFVYQIIRRIQKTICRYIINTISIMFTMFMVIGRLLSGVHWLSDIIGSILLSIGLFCLYIGFVKLIIKE